MTGCRAGDRCIGLYNETSVFLINPEEERAVLLRISPTQLLYVLAVAVSMATPATVLAAVFDNGQVNTVSTTMNEPIDVFDGPGDQQTTVFFETGAEVITADGANDDNSLAAFENSRVVINGGRFTQDITFFDTSSLAINGGEIGDDVFLQGDSTGTMSGGLVRENVLLFERAAFGITGGRVNDDVVVEEDGFLTLSGGEIGTDFVAFDDARVEISGGLIGGDLVSRNRSDVEVSDGQINGSVEAGGRSSVDVMGGSIGNDLFAEGRAVVEFSGGTVADDVTSTERATIIILGGVIGSDIEAAGDSTIEIFGGELLGNDLDFGIASGDDALIRIFGSDFEINGSAADFGLISESSGTLSGRLSDGNTFSLPFARIEETILIAGFFPVTFGPGDIELVFMPVPEPASLMLVLGGAGVVLFSRRRPDED